MASFWEMAQLTVLLYQQLYVYYSINSKSLCACSFCRKAMGPKCDLPNCLHGHVMFACATESRKLECQFQQCSVVSHQMYASTQCPISGYLTQFSCH